MVCPACGKAAGQGSQGGTATAPATATTGGMADNVVGMLAYITFIPAVIFLVMEPYNRNRFVRFHSLQSIFFCVGAVVVGVALSILSMIPFLGWIVGMLLSVVFSLGVLIVWIVLLLKAYQGQMFKLPVIGDMAEKQANTM